MQRAFQARFLESGAQAGPPPPGPYVPAAAVAQASATAQLAGAAPEQAEALAASAAWRAHQASVARGGFQERLVASFGDCATLCEAGGAQRVVRAVLEPVLCGSAAALVRTSADAGRWQRCEVWVNRDRSRLCWAGLERPLSVMRGRGQESVLGTSSLALASVVAMSARELDACSGGGSDEAEGAAEEEAGRGPLEDPEHVITLTATDFALKLGSVRTLARPKVALEVRLVLPSAELHEQWVYGLALLRILAGSSS